MKSVCENEKCGYEEERNLAGYTCPFCEYPLRFIPANDYEFLFTDANTPMDVEADTLAQAMGMVFNLYPEKDLIYIKRLSRTLCGLCGCTAECDEIFSPARDAANSICLPCQRDIYLAFNDRVVERITNFDLVSDFKGKNGDDPNKH